MVKEKTRVTCLVHTKTAGTGLHLTKVCSYMVITFLKETAKSERSLYLDQPMAATHSIVKEKGSALATAVQHGNGGSASAIRQES
jgi:hypothetical protein